MSEIVNNNRKRTKGRTIQVVKVPEYKGFDLITGRPKKNDHPNAGKTIQIRRIKK